MRSDLILSIETHLSIERRQFVCMFVKSSRLNGLINFDLILIKKKFEIKLWICFRSTLILSVGVLLSGEIFKFITFVSVYPEVIIYLIGLAVVGAMGQMFIFFMVRIFILLCSFQLYIYYA